MTEGKKEGIARIEEVKSGSDMRKALVSPPSNEQDAVNVKHLMR